MEPLEEGAEYFIEHRRKGPFTAKIIKDNGEFVEVQVTKGRANFISIMNTGRGMVGDTFSIRKSFCTFKKSKVEFKMEAFHKKCECGHRESEHQARIRFGYYVRLGCHVCACKRFFPEKKKRKQK